MKPAFAVNANSSRKPVASDRRRAPPRGPANPAARPADKASAEVGRPARGEQTKANSRAKPTSVGTSQTLMPDAKTRSTKPPKIRLVRDSFTMPEAEFALVAVLKARALGLGRAAKKSELLRAGLQLLGMQDPPALLAALERLQPIKTGRPKRGD